jgi:hypothetical protein
MDYTHIDADDRIPLGAITVLAGDPGTGASLLAALMAADISYVDPVTRFDSLFVTADDPKVVLDRVASAGGDTSSHVHVVYLVDGDEGRRPFSLPENLDLLQESILRHDAKLVVLDRGTDFIGRPNETLPRLHDLAERTGAAIVVVMTLRPDGFGPTGPSAYRLAARSVLTLSAQDDPHLVLEHKTSHEGTALAAPQTFMRVRSDDGATERLVTVEDQPDVAPPQWRQADVEEWLASILMDGPMDVEEIRRFANGAAIPWSAVKRARKALGVKKADAPITGRKRWSGVV